MTDEITTDQFIKEFVSKISIKYAMLEIKILQEKHIEKGTTISKKIHDILAETAVQEIALIINLHENINDLVIEHSH